MKNRIANEVNGFLASFSPSFPPAVERIPRRSVIYARDTLTMKTIKVCAPLRGTMARSDDVRSHRQE
jgi:hypothetical protein